MKKLLFVIIIILISSSIFAQRIIGQVVLQELLITTSANSSGMGDVGVSLSGYESGFHNPASIALFGLKNELAISSYMNKPLISDGDYYSAQLVIPLQDFFSPESNYSYTFSFSYLDKSDEVFEINFDSGLIGPGEYIDIKHQIYQFIFASALTKDNFDFGYGLSLKYLEEEYKGYTSNLLTGDVGAIFRYKISFGLSDTKFRPHLTFSTGLSFANFGSIKDYRGIDSPDKLYSTLRWGANFEYSLKFNQFKNYDWNLLTIMPVFEFEKVRDDNIYWKLGLEASLIDAVKGRVRLNHIITYGFSVHTKGLYKAFLLSTGDYINSSGPSWFLGNRLDIVYSFNHKQEYSSQGNTLFGYNSDYHTLTILVQL